MLLSIRKISLFLSILMIASAVLAASGPAMAAETKLITTAENPSYDPVGDVRKSSIDGGMQYTSGFAHIDILKISGSADDKGTALLLDDLFKFSIQLAGTIQDDDSVQYIILLGTTATDYVLQYKDGISTVTRTSDGVTIPATPSKSTVTKNNDMLTFAIKKELMGGALPGLEWSAVAYDEESDVTYIDIGPDKLARITAPYEDSTIYGTVTVKGEISWWDASQAPSTVTWWTDSGSHSTANVDSNGDFQFDWDTSAITTAGTHTIHIRAISSGYTAADDMDVRVNQAYSDPAQRPEITTGPSMYVGAHFEYEALGEADALSIEFTTATSMSLDVVSEETVGSIDTLRYHLVQDGSLIIGPETVTSHLERDTWREKIELGIVKEYTDATVEGERYLDPTNMKTEATYSPAMKETNFPLKVTDSWDVTSTVDRDSTITIEGDSPITGNSLGPKTIHNEALYQAQITVPKGTFDCIVIHREEAGTGVYTLDYYSETVGASVKLETYDSNRNLVGALGLKNYGKVLINVTNIAIDPAPVKDKESTITVTIKNTGNIALAAEQVIDVKANGVTIGTVTLNSLAAGAETTKTITWKPTSTGSVQITAENFYGSSAKSITVKDPNGGGGDIDPMMLMLIAIVLVIVILVAVIAAKKRGRALDLEESETQEAPAAIVDAPPQPQQAPVQEVDDAVVVTGDGAEAEEKEEPAKADSAQEITCPKCQKKSFVVMTQRPMRFSCPHCGTSGTIK